MNESIFPKKTGFIKVTSKLIFSKLWQKGVEETFTDNFLSFFTIHLGLGYFLLLNLVETAQRSGTKSKSCCYHVSFNKVFPHF